MNFKQIIKHSFNRSAFKYDEHSLLQKNIANELFGYYLNKISADDVILDAGCGTGCVHELIRKNKLKNQLYQIDIAYNMCQIAKDYSSDHCYTINADVEFIPLKNNCINFIISSLALQWTNLEIVVAEFFRILSNNGKTIISVFNQDSLIELSQSFKLLNNTKTIIDLPRYEYLPKILKNFNFKNIDITHFTIVNYHDSVIEVMQQIKSIGASASVKRNKLTKQKLDKLEQIYFNNFAKNNKLPTTWNYSIIYAEK